MVPKIDQSSRQEYLTKTTLSVFFLLIFVLFIFWMSREHALEKITLSPLDLVLLGLATFRLGRLVAYDRVMEPLRYPFARTVPDETGAGESVEPQGKGFRQAIGQLISCPICSGTWIAAILVYGFYAFPGPTRVFLTIAAVIGLAELLNALGEMMSWSGQLARTRAGSLMKEEKRQLEPSGEQLEPTLEGKRLSDAEYPPRTRSRD